MMSSTKFKKIAQATSCLLFSLSKKVLLDFAILAYDCRFFGNDSQTSQRGLKIISEKSQMMQARLIFLQFSNTVSSATLIKLWKSSQKFFVQFWLTLHWVAAEMKWISYFLYFACFEIIFGRKMILEKLKLIIGHRRRGWKQVVKLSFVRMLLRTS